VAINPPAFTIFVNEPEYVHFSYQRYLENQIRSNFDFTGTPIKLLFRKRD
jgi:GTP-binding protein